MDGRRSVLAVSRTDYDILTALRLGDEFGFAPIVLGGQEAYKIADQLAAARTPVILGPLRTNGPFGPERTELAWNVAGVLHEAGVPVALSGGDLLEQARFASRFGLPREAAIRAITSEPGPCSASTTASAPSPPAGTPTSSPSTATRSNSPPPIRWVMVDGVVRFPRPEAGEQED